MPLVGLNVHVLTDETVAETVALGVRHVRTTLYWPLWDRVPSYPLAFHELVTRCDRAGIKLLVVVHNWWPADGVQSSPVDPVMMERFAEFVGARAADFPTVEAWQLWNEQDAWVQAPFGAGSGTPMRSRGQAYATQLRLAYPRIKEANPAALVVTGGLAGEPTEFLAGMMVSRPPCDAIAVHGYGLWQYVRGRLTTAGQYGVPVWLTEAGNVPGGNQITNWRSVLEGNDRERLAARVYPYALDGGQDVYHTLRGSDTEAWLRGYLDSRGA